MFFTKRKTERAWAAGFFDGEGCITVHNSKTNPFWRIHVAQTELTSLERFRITMGCGTIVGPYIPKNRDKSKRKPIWFYRTNTPKQTIEVLKILLPYLCVKKDQAENALYEMTGV